VIDLKHFHEGLLPQTLDCKVFNCVHEHVVFRRVTITFEPRLSTLVLPVIRIDFAHSGHVNRIFRLAIGVLLL
jgi:hypothetical protein